MKALLIIVINLIFIGFSIYLDTIVKITSAPLYFGLGFLLCFFEVVIVFGMED